MNKIILAGVGIMVLLLVVWVTSLDENVICNGPEKLVLMEYGIVDVQSCSSIPFNIQGRLVSLVSIEFGQPSDCESGCIYNKFLTIFDETQDYPLYLYMNGLSEYNILNLSEIELLSEYSNKFHGRLHPLAESQEFRSYLSTTKPVLLHRIDVERSRQTNFSDETIFSQSDLNGG